MGVRARARRSASSPLFGMLAVLTVIGLAAVGAGMFAVVSRSADLGADPRRAAVPAAGPPSSVPAGFTAPEPGRTGSATCTDPVANQEWRVSWRAVTGYDAGPTYSSTTAAPSPTNGPTSSPTNGSGSPARRSKTGDRTTPTTLPTTPAATTTDAGPPPNGYAAADFLLTGFSSRIGNGPWLSQDDALWRLRWTPRPGGPVPVDRPGTYQRDGTLVTLSPITPAVDSSPRYLTPDGSCTVFLAPFDAGPAGTSGTRGTSGAAGSVALVGDDLAEQAAPDLRRPAQLGERPSVLVTEPGARWTTLPGAAGALDRAGTSELDELRGLHSAGGLVVGLGSADAEWIAAAPSRSQVGVRQNAVLAQLSPLLAGLDDADRCTVLLTVAQPAAPGAGPTPAARRTATADRFATAAGLINAMLVQAATAETGDRLKVWDWAGAAAGHRIGSPDPWFDDAAGPHLTSAGVTAYADALARAATLC